MAEPPNQWSSLMPEPLLQIRVRNRYTEAMVDASKVVVSIPNERLNAQVNVAIERGHIALAGVGRFESADLIRADRAMRDARDRRR
jgi:hypothetical protein